MPVETISPVLTALFLNPNIQGYERFFTTYLFIGEKKAIIDTGPSSAVASLLEELSQLRIDPADIDYIILSHIHMDHSGGAGLALQEMKKATVIAHTRAFPHLINPAKLWEASKKTLGDLALKYGEIEGIPENRILPVSDSMELDLRRNLTLDIFETPGHASHHLSVYHQSSRTLIAGEAAGVCIDGAIRPSTPPPFKYEEALSSIERLIALQPQTVCFAHLGCVSPGVDFLYKAKEKLSQWHISTNVLAKEGKSTEEILEQLKGKDPDLTYLNRLTLDEQIRERKMLINSIIGMTGQR